MIARGVLRADQEADGYQVVEVDDHLVELQHNGGILATFCWHVSVETLQDAADDHKEMVEGLATMRRLGGL